MLTRICLMTLLLLAACSKGGGGETADAADLGTPGTTLMRDSVYEHLQEFDSIGINANRDASHHPENVIDKLHSYLTEGRGLKRIQIDGHETLVLKRLPESVYQQILAVAFPDNFRSGFEVLQASFWKQVHDALAEGLTIGFLEPDPSFNVSGVYFEKFNWGRGLILIDVFAGEGTLMHEHRHYVQALKAKARAKARGWDDEGPSAISQNCLAQTSRFLGELDSTTTELPNWIGVFQTLDVTPAWHKTAKRGDSDPVRFPQVFMLVTNLDYPGRSATGLKSQDCPQELLDAATKIKSSTDDFETKLTQGYTSRLFSLRMEDFHAWTYLNSSCSASSDVCTEKQSRIAAIPGEAQAIKDTVDNTLRAESADRPERIRQVFASLPDSIQEDLCEYAAGYELLVDCKPFDAKRKEKAQ
ncbi:MAG: hypothetical protein ACXVB9_11035 [Bdellovibrionota bacterium]